MAVPDISGGKRANEKENEAESMQNIMKREQRKRLKRMETCEGDRGQKGRRVLGWWQKHIRRRNEKD